MKFLNIKYECIDPLDDFHEHRKKQAVLESASMEEELLNTLNTTKLDEIAEKIKL